MSHFCLVQPGAFGASVIDAAAAVLKSTGAPVEVETVPVETTPLDIKPAEGDALRLYTLKAPNPDLIDSFIEWGWPGVAACDRIRPVARSAISGRGVLNGLAFASSTFSSLADAMIAHDLPIILRERIEKQRTTLEAEAAAAFGIELPPAFVGKAGREDGKMPLPSEVVAELDTARAAFEGLRRAAVDRARRPVHWSRAAFFDGDNQGKRPDLTNDLTGPARIVYYGPYFSLPRGRWRAEMEIGLSEHTEELPILFEIVVEKSILCAVRAIAPGPGLFAADFEFENTDPNGRVEARVVILEGCIEGRISLIGAHLTPTD